MDEKPNAVMLALGKKGMGPEAEEKSEEGSGDTALSLLAEELKISPKALRKLCTWIKTQDDEDY